jgi:archaeosortase B (VPXXXP-CTERM-specific)
LECRSGCGDSVSRGTADRPRGANDSMPNHDSHEAGADAPAGGPPEVQKPSLAERLRGVYANPANRFVVLFLIYLGVLAYFYPRLAIRYSDVMDLLAEWTALVEYQVFVLFSDAVTHNGKMIVFGGFAVQIIEECTGLYEVLIFTAAVLAFPTTLVKKAIGIAGGAPILYAINVARIAFLMVVGRYWPASFDFMHLYFWQATLILMITSVWLLWIFKVVRHEGPARTA